jgi:microsomal dipeptidase-like Zn-dependent dipeptidase
MNTADPQGSERWNDRRTEMHSSAETLLKIRSLGGVVGVLTNQGYLTTNQDSPINNDCETSSKSFATAYVYALNKMGGTARLGVGSDVNGLAG